MVVFRRIFGIFFFMLFSSLLSLSSSWTTTTTTTILRTRGRSWATRLLLQQQQQQQQQHPNQQSILRNIPSISTSSALRMISSSSSSSSSSTETSSSLSTNMINLQTIHLEELETILFSWGHPKYRAKQIYNWVRVQGVTDVDRMQNIPKTLIQQLKQHSSTGSLNLEFEQISKDGTRKRAYALPDGQLIESVLMPYRDGRYTACISSQAGCAQGCVFCATGQMGFSRQLTADEIFEQVARFSSELAYQDKHQDDDDDNDHDHDVNNRKRMSTQRQQHHKQTRLSNIVFMGMGEPLANYRNVVKAVKRIQSELGIGHRKITISTVGIVPNIMKLAYDLPQVRLAVSLHCASDEERSDLLPANYRYGGLDRLMETLKEYSITTGKRITLEWALIENENDTPETAHKLGRLIQKWLRPDMVHINVIPLNPTGGYGGSPSGRSRVNAFTQILEKQYGVACTPRVRRGIDIDAGCGQLKAEVEKKKKKMEQQQQTQTKNDDGKLYDDDSMISNKRNDSPAANDDGKIQIKVVNKKKKNKKNLSQQQQQLRVKAKENASSRGNHRSNIGSFDEEKDDDDVIIMSDENDWQDYEYSSISEKDEMNRLISLVKDSVVTKENQVVTTPQGTRTTTPLSSAGHHQHPNKK